MSAQSAAVELDSMLVLPLVELMATGKNVLSHDAFEETDYLPKVLSSQSGIFIRDYGSGQLATASFRGMSANHTLVTWQGIPLNSPSLGQVDLSLFPMTLFRKGRYISNASELHQSGGALGGKIALSNPVDTVLQWRGKLQQNFSDLLSSTTALGLQKGFAVNHQQIYTDTRLFYHLTENRFRYQDFNRAEHPVVHSTDSGFQQFHLMESLSWFPNKRASHLKADVWLGNSQRALAFSSATQGDQFFRSVLQWNSDKNYSFKAAYLKEKQSYIDPSVQLTARTLTHRLFARADYHLQKEKSFWYTGLEVQRDAAKTGGFSQQKQQSSTAGFLSARWYPNSAIAAYATLREAWQIGDAPDMMYHLGVSMEVLSLGKHTLKTTLHQYKNIHYPTLNDLYWEPGGNPALQAETLLGGELNISHTFQQHEYALKIQSDASLYYHVLSDRILWTPSSTSAYWTAVNVNQVKGQGLNYTLKLQKALGSDYQLYGAVHYSYAKTTDVSTQRQLIYTPIHQANASWSIENIAHQWQLKYEHLITGKRYTLTDNAAFLPAYYSGRLLISYGFGHRLNTRMQLKINNLWNKHYEVIQGRPMPLRYVELGVVAKF